MENRRSFLLRAFVAGAATLSLTVPAMACRSRRRGCAPTFSGCPPGFGFAGEFPPRYGPDLGDDMAFPISSAIAGSDFISINVGLVAPWFDPRLVYKFTIYRGGYDGRWSIHYDRQIPLGGFTDRLQIPDATYYMTG